MKSTIEATSNSIFHAYPEATNAGLIHRQNVAGVTFVQLVNNLRGAEL